MLGFRSRGKGDKRKHLVLQSLHPRKFDSTWFSSKLVRLLPPCLSSGIRSGHLHFSQFKQEYAHSVICGDLAAGHPTSKDKAIGITSRHVCVVYVPGNNSPVMCFWRKNVAYLQNSSCCWSYTFEQ